MEGKTKKTRYRRTKRPVPEQYITQGLDQRSPRQLFKTLVSQEDSSPKKAFITPIKNGKIPKLPKLQNLSIDASCPEVRQSTAKIETSKKRANTATRVARFTKFKLVSPSYVESTSANNSPKNSQADMMKSIFQQHQNIGGLFSPKGQFSPKRGRPVTFKSPDKRDSERNKPLAHDQLISKILKEYKIDESWFPTQFENNPGHMMQRTNVFYYAN